mmetsp:Transcript_26507/g.68401  ORF Transcript_26507/g.68401 Transcript_26507/m.68401 type:complete len:157 (-) Transcript_26507:257-727(-)
MMDPRHDDREPLAGGLFRALCVALTNPIPEFSSPWGPPPSYARRRPHDEVLPCGLTRHQVRILETRELTPEDHELLLMLDSRLDKKRVLAQNELSSALADAPGARRQQCPICLEKIESRFSASKLRKCGHAFHKKCITHWLTTGRDVCPLCFVVAR